MSGTAINFTINIEGNAITGVAALDDAMNNLTVSASKTTNIFDTLGASALKLNAIADSVQKVGQGMQSLVGSSLEFEQQERNIQTLLKGDAKATEELIGKISEYGKATVYDRKGLIEAQKTMMSFGISAEAAFSQLKVIGDIAMGDSQKMQALTLAFSQATSTGKLMGQDLMQMINAGFNPLQAISEKTGESMNSLKDRMAKGGISAQELAQAFKWATEEGSLFYKGAEKGAETVAGKIAKINDTIAEFQYSLFKWTGGATAYVGEFGKLVGQFANLIPVITLMNNAFAKLSRSILKTASAQKLLNLISQKGGSVGGKLLGTGVKAGVGKVATGGVVGSTGIGSIATGLASVAGSVGVVLGGIAAAGTIIYGVGKVLEMNVFGGRKREIEKDKAMAEEKRIAFQQELQAIKTAKAQEAYRNKVYESVAALTKFNEKANPEKVKGTVDMLAKLETKTTANYIALKDLQSNLLRRYYEGTLKDGDAELAAAIISNNTLKDRLDYTEMGWAANAVAKNWGSSRTEFDTSAGATDNEWMQKNIWAIYEKIAKGTPSPTPTVDDELKGLIDGFNNSANNMANEISSGGKSVKNFNITIGSLIDKNTNQFSSSSDNPETATGFMQKLSDALQMIVNDVNYAAE